jgi:hypothetical protein
MAVSPPCSSGSSPGLLGESCRVLFFEHSQTCSDAFRDFFDFFWASSTLHDAADASASCPGSPGSTFVLPGEHFRPFGFERLLTRTDMSSSFIGRFQSSWSHPGAPDMSASPLTCSTSQLEAVLSWPPPFGLASAKLQKSGMTGLHWIDWSQSIK